MSSPSRLVDLRLGQIQKLRVQTLAVGAHAAILQHQRAVQTRHRANSQLAGLRVCRRRAQRDRGVVDAAKGQGLQHATVNDAKVKSGVHHLVPAREGDKRASRRQVLGVVEVVLSVVVERQVDVGDCRGCTQGLDHEGVVGPAGAGDLDHGDAAGAQKIGAIDGRPDGRVVQ